MLVHLSAHSFTRCTTQVNHNGTIEFEEFETVLAVSRCAEKLLSNQILAYKTTIARHMALCEDQTITSTEQHRTREEREAMVKIHIRNMEKYIKGLKEKMTMLGGLTMDALDQFAMLMLILNR